jgi:hypothetical protein
VGKGSWFHVSAGARSLSHTLCVCLPRFSAVRHAHWRPGRCCYSARAEEVLFALTTTPHIWHFALPKKADRVTATTANKRPRLVIWRVGPRSNRAHNDGRYDGCRRANGCLRSVVVCHARTGTRLRRAGSGWRHQLGHVRSDPTQPNHPHRVRRALVAHIGRYVRSRGRALRSGAR